MNAFLLVPLLLLLVTAPVFGQMLSDRTGIVSRLDVEAGGHTFEVETVSNFNIVNHTFDEDKKQLTLYISSGLENNLGEVIIPRDLLGGDLTVYLNDNRLHPDIKSNDRISFITLNFTGTGSNKIDVFGVAHSGTSDTESEAEDGGGCLVATAAYGSELAPQVQLLREIRDEKLLNTSYGAAFMSEFNRLYYLFSPHVADYQRENPAFREAVNIAITPLLMSLGIMSLADSENQVLGYGVMVILLNVGLYVAAPVAASVFLCRLVTR